MVWVDRSCREAVESGEGELEVRWEGDAAVGSWGFIGLFANLSSRSAAAHPQSPACLECLWGVLMVHTQLVSCLSGLPRASCEITCVRSGVEGLLQASGEPACARGEQEFSCAALQSQVECKSGMSSRVSSRTTFASPTQQAGGPSH